MDLIHKIVIIFNIDFKEVTNDMEEIWNELHSTRKWGVYPSEFIIRFVARNYYNEKRDSIRILDFGCGAGAHTWYLAREGFDVYAFDGSHYAIDNAKVILENEGLKAKLSVIDGVDAVYEESFFDAVIDSACICTNRMSDIETMYNNIFSMLKPGGKLLSTCFTIKTTGYGEGDYVEKGTYANIKEGPLKNMLIHFFSEDELFDLLNGIGFKHIKFDFLCYSDNGRIIDEYVVQAEK